MTKPNTVTSEALKLNHGNLCKGELCRVICVSALEHWFHVPTANRYWIQLSTQQWPDKSGVGLWFYLDMSGWGTYQWYGRYCKTCIDRGLFYAFQDMMLDAVYPMDHDGLVKLYIRLLYEE